MGGGKSDAPDPPDYEALAAGSVESAELWAQVARDQLDWAKEQDASNRELLQSVLDVQLPQLEMAYENAVKDRQRYEETFQPIEDNLIKDFESYDSPERREQEASKRIADVRQTFEAQRRNQMRELEDYGIDPSETRYQALDLGYRAQEAANAALAANQGRQQVEDTGRALRGEAINIGRGMPAQVAQSQATVNNTANSAVNNSNQTTNTGVNANTSAYGAGGISQSGYGTAANIQNAGYQNSLARYNANANSGAALWGGVGTLGGALLGNAGLFAAEGGEVPEDLATTPQPGDKYPVMLGDDEFVIPADVVRKKGTEFFDKLLDKYKDGGEYEAKRQESAIPAG